MDGDNTQFGAGSGSTGGAGNTGSTGNTADLNSGTSSASDTSGFSGYGGNTGNTGTEGYGSSGSTGAGDFGAAGGMSGNTGNESNARKLADMARNAASQAKQKAGEQVSSSVDKGRTRAADTLQEVARTLMGSGTGTGDAANNPATQYLSKAGEQVQRFADYLQNTEPRELVANTESFARRQPALFLGSAFALGVLAARFLKATRDESDMYGDGGQGRLYDRETALSSYRDGVSEYSPSLGVSDTRGPLGDDELDWPSGMGNVDSSSTGSGLGDDLGTTGGSGYNSTR